MTTTIAIIITIPVTALVTVGIARWTGVLVKPWKEEAVMGGCGAAECEPVRKLWPEGARTARVLRDPHVLRVPPAAGAAPDNLGQGGEVGVSEPARTWLLIDLLRTLR